MTNVAQDSPAERSHWLSGAHQNVRVIAALLRREMLTHFGELRLGYLWAIIEPGLHLGVYALLFVYIFKRHNPLGGSLVLFMLTGLMTYFLYSKLASYLAGAVDGNRALLNLPPVKPLDVLVARAILEASTYLLVGFILLVTMYLFDGTDVVPSDALELVAALVCTIGFGVGVGMTNAVIRTFIPNWMTIFGMISSPAFLLSGIWFLPSQIPMPYRELILYIPLAQYITWVRTAFYSHYKPTDLDRGYAIWCSVVAVGLGLALLRVARRKILEPL
jgi:capsular polysaccharide transport system permease protein